MGTNIHILNGDALAEQFQESILTDNFISWREILVEGPITADSPENLFSLRKAYLDDTFPDPDRTYDTLVFPEMQKVMNLPLSAAVYLWFEDDLFCQVNMWAVMWLLPERTDLQVYRVFPAGTDPEYRWMGFGANKPDDLPTALNQAVEVNDSDLQLGINLWKAFVKDDRAGLQRLANETSPVFRDLPEVVQAWNDHPDRIRKTIQASLDEGETEFGPVFRKVWKEHGIYGFGDLQIKRLFDEMTG